MKAILLPIVLFIAFTSSAQKEDLKKLNDKLNTVIHSSDGLHMEYTLVIKGTGGETDTMDISLYKKSEQAFKMVMGSAQTLLRKDNMMLKVDHINRVIAMQQDSAVTTDDRTLFEELAALTDSAKTISFVKEKEELIYTLTYTSDFIYKRIQLKFSSKTGLPSGVYAEFSPDNDQPYYSLFAVYNLWDLKWKDKKDELELRCFVEKKNDRYQPIAAYSSYQVFIPEQGKMNVDFK